MRPLVLEDLLPLAEYAARRREFFAAHQRYVQRRRRVRIGPAVTLIFENRQTMWFRAQEFIRIARLSATPMIQRELDLCNRLLPGRSRLQASMLIQLDESRLSTELDRWHALQGDHIRMHLGDASIPGDLLTCRPEDRCAGTAFWVQFALSAAHQKALKKAAPAVSFEVELPDYQHASKPISKDVRLSLAEDLDMSARDAA
jgi:hypothetical protein